jgi:RNA polymerase sigma factor (sigma-70 family)
MKDFRVRVTVRNNALLECIERAGYKMGKKACASLGLNYATVSDLVAMRTSPIGPDGQWRPIVLDLVDALGRAPEEMFHTQHLTPLIKGSVERKADAQEVFDLLNAPDAPEPIAALEHRELTEAVDDALSKLTDRERLVLERHTMGGETLDEIAATLGVVRERVRQIEAKALRKLRRPDMNRRLIQFVPIDETDKEDAPRAAALR